MKYQIRHATTYSYAENVSLSQNHARLAPLHNELQLCHEYDIQVTPGADYQDEYTDYFGNVVTVFEVPTLHKTMVVTATSVVEILPRPQQGLFEYYLSWEQVRDLLQHPRDTMQLSAAEFALATPTTQATTEIRDYTLQSFTPGRSLIPACDDLMGRIFEDFSFDPAFSTINTPVKEVFLHKKGVCQDFAHLSLTCLRSIGLAAKYVSGYIETIPPPGVEKLTGADATHAWFAVFVPGLGWLDFDPTNNLKPAEQHVTLATGRDFYDVTPLKGVMFGGGAHQLAVAVDMNRIND
ncbi:MAG: transglutaminase N-terminal domain-containing protein [Aestuariibacter sp.]